jgi:putative ABC transport system permease protein
MLSMRDFAEVVRSALTALGRSPVRSGLTVLGLAIGVGAFIAMTSFGEGAKGAVVSQFAALGTNLVRIESLVGDPAVGPRGARPLTERDVAALRSDVPTAGRIVPLFRNRVTAAGRGTMADTWVYGTTHDYFGIHGWRVASGGIFDANDTTQRAKVCVLGATPAWLLFGSREPLGQTVSLGDALTCHVIGVLVSKGLSTGGRDLDNQIFIPSSSHEAYLGGANGYTDIEVEAADPRVMNRLRLEIFWSIRRMHGLRDGDPDDVRITSPTEAIRAAENVSTILARLLAAIAAVSLLVGGIGIMNIQLVAVAERTREIGIRAAIGASPQQILVQFLAEAIVLSSIGALVGIAAGVGGALVVARAMHWSRAIDPMGVVAAALFGIGAGIVFGYMPARRAAQLDPIDALRHE